MAATLILHPEAGLTFDDLYRREGLLKLDQRFLDELARSDATLHERLTRARAEPANLATRQESELLLALVPHLERTIASLFGIEQELRVLASRHHQLAPLYSVKRLFVQRKAMHKFQPHEAQAVDGHALERELAAAFGEPFTELAYARHVTAWQQD